MKLDFNPNEYKDAREFGGFSPLPAGMYNAVVERVEKKPGKDLGKEYLSIGFIVTSGEYEGRWIWSNMFLWGYSDNFMAYQRKLLGMLGNAVGLAALTDTDDLLGKEARIELIVEEDKKGERDPQNRVVGFEPVGAVTASRAAPVRHDPDSNLPF